MFPFYVQGFNCDDERQRVRKGTCAEAGDAMVVAHGERAGVAQRQEDPTVYERG